MTKPHLERAAIFSAISSAIRAARRLAGPVRLPLGLALATAAATGMMAGMAAAVSTPVAARGLTADLLACRDIADADERLACYDRVVERRNESARAPAAASAPEARTADPAADPRTDPRTDSRTDSRTSAPATRPAEPGTAATPAPRADGAAETGTLPSAEELFGRDPAAIQREVDRATGREALQQIAGEVVELVEMAPDRIAVKLDNGQIWRQTVPGRFFLREGHQVEIRRASLGSYMLSRAGSNRSIRVERAD